MPEPKSTNDGAKYVDTVNDKKSNNDGKAPQTNAVNDPKSTAK